jgi:hypothetical protein
MRKVQNVAKLMRLYFSTFLGDREVDPLVNRSFTDVVLEGGYELVGDASLGVLAELAKYPKPRALDHHVEADGETRT